MSTSQNISNVDENYLRIFSSNNHSEWRDEQHNQLFRAFESKSFDNESGSETQFRLNDSECSSGDLRHSPKVKDINHSSFLSHEAEQSEVIMRIRFVKFVDGSTVRARTLGLNEHSCFQISLAGH